MMDVVHTRPWLQALVISLGHHAHNLLNSRVLTTEHWYALLHSLVAALQLLPMCRLSPILRSQYDVDVTALDRDRLLLSLEQKQWYEFATSSTHLAFEGPTAYCAALQSRGCIVFQNISVDCGSASDPSLWTQLRFSGMAALAVTSEPEISAPAVVSLVKCFEEVAATRDNEFFWLPLVDPGANDL